MTNVKIYKRSPLCLRDDGWPEFIYVFNDPYRGDTVLLPVRDGKEMRALGAYSKCELERRGYIEQVI